MTTETMTESYGTRGSSSLPLVIEKEHFRDTLLAFINHPDATGDTALFERGLIDSLAILNLIALVEQTTGHPVPPRMVVMKHFRTINAIVDTFWKEAA